MPPFGPISRRDLVRALRIAGFDGPYSGGKHPIMLKGDLALTLPNRGCTEFCVIGGRSQVPPGRRDLAILADTRFGTVPPNPHHGDIGRELLSRPIVEA
jgi:hypothetical protein